VALRVRPEYFKADTRREGDRWVSSGELNLFNNVNYNYRLKKLNMNNNSRRLILTASVLLSLFAPSNGSDNDTIPAIPSVQLSGFIKSDFIFDSRQNLTVRENMFLLYPLPVLADQEGMDVNEVRNIQFIPFQTRLSAFFSGTELLNARATGLIEGEFFGTSDADINGFRLRHATINLHWKSGVSILMGQFWHPLFITGCYPTTASFNTGAPFNPFSRNPQLEISYTTGSFRYSVAALSQLDFRSSGPEGPSAKYLRNSGFPEMAAKVYWLSPGQDLMLGAASSYKVLRPGLADETGRKADELTGSGAVMAFSRYSRGNKTLKAAVTLGQDMFHLTMIGGYAERAGNGSGEAPGTGTGYTPLSTFAAWAELVTGETWQAGLFSGYSSNLGARDIISSDIHPSVIFARGSDLNFLYRISPRLSYNASNMRLGAEAEYTRAFYSRTFDNRGRPAAATGTGNLRLLFFAFYKF
jgi:hypothetical protein